MCKKRTFQPLIFAVCNIGLSVMLNCFHEQVDSDSDEETIQKLEQIDLKITNKFLKHRDKLSEKDMKRLMNEARRQQDEILRQRKIERLRQNDLMREKLIAKRNAKVGILFHGKIQIRKVALTEVCVFVCVCAQ